MFLHWIEINTSSMRTYLAYQLKENNRKVIHTNKHQCLMTITIYINALDNVDSFVIHHSLDYYLHRINKYMD